MQNKDTGLEAIFTMERGDGNLVEEPPFHLLVLGDWSGDAEKPELPARSPIEIDRDDFDAVIARLGARLRLKLGIGELELEFNELDDFHPDQIFRRVPLFSELRELRKRLNSEDTFHLAAREVREKFWASGGPEERPETNTAEEVVAASGDDLLDAILTKPTGGAAVPKPKPSDDLGMLISDLVRPHLVSVDDTERSGYVSAVDEATSELMRSIVHDARFKELEAAWRGLYFLVRRTETSTSLKIFLFDISKDELGEDLRTSDNLEKTVIYRHLVENTEETKPWAVTLGNYLFRPELDDIALVMRLAKVSAAANAPFISQVSSGVFGIDSLSERSDPADWRLPDGSNAAKLWAALSDQPEAVYLGMTMPRFLVRLPYGSDTEPLETFSFEECVDSPTHEDYLWSNAAFVAGQLLAASFSERGWQMGRALNQDIEGLPMHVYKEGTETVFKPCGEALLSDRAVDIMINKGLMPLVSYKNTDKVKLAQFQSIAGTALRGRWS